MKIDDDTLKYVENLSKFSLNDKEKKERRKDLEEILTFVDKLNELDTSGVKETNNPIGAVNFTREDEVVKNDLKEKLLDNAPKRKDDFIKTIKVIED